MVSRDAASAHACQLEVIAESDHEDVGAIIGSESNARVADIGMVEARAIVFPLDKGGEMLIESVPQAYLCLESDGRVAARRLTARQV